jgi:hypothetical protein
MCISTGCNPSRGKFQCAILPAPSLPVLDSETIAGVQHHFLPMPSMPLRFKSSGIIAMRNSTIGDGEAERQALSPNFHRPFRHGNLFALN